jgi:hypothetical protein
VLYCVHLKQEYGVKLPVLKSFLNSSPHFPGLHVAERRRDSGHDIETIAPFSEEGRSGLARNKFGLFNEFRRPGLIVVRLEADELQGMISREVFHTVVRNDPASRSGRKRSVAHDDK